MRMVKKTNSSPEEYTKMLQKVLDTKPYGLLNQIYDPKNQICYLYFWDTDYIPEEWEEWIVRPVSKMKRYP